MPFDILVKQNATVDDTLRLIVNAVNVCSASPFVQTLTTSLQPNVPGFPRRLFDYICRNATYELDTPGVEEVWTPEKVIREGKFDCKKVSVLLSSVLKAAGFDPVLKHVYYQGANGSLKDYTHIYVVLPNPDLRNYLTLDPTNDCKYNSEVDSSKQTLYFLNGEKMELHMMGKKNGSVNTSSFVPSINAAAASLDNDLRSISGVQTIGTLYNKAGNFNYTIAQNVEHIAAIPVLAIPRAAFLGLLYLGGLLKNTSLKINLPWNLANAWGHTSNNTDLSTNSASQFRKTWWLLGGAADAAALKNAILAGTKGTGVTSAGMGATDEAEENYDIPYILTDAMQGHGMNGIGQGPETLAAIAAATPIIIKFLDLIKKNFGGTTPGPDTPAAVPPTGQAVPPTGIPPTPPPPQGNSFATYSIDNVNDLLNFCKAAGVMLIGAALHPALILPTNILIAASFLYAIRKNIFSK